MDQNYLLHKENEESNIVTMDLASRKERDRGYFRLHRLRKILQRGAAARQQNMGLPLADGSFSKTSPLGHRGSRNPRRVMKGRRGLTLNERRFQEAA